MDKRSKDDLIFIGFIFALAFCMGLYVTVMAYVIIGINWFVESLF